MQKWVLAKHGLVTNERIRPNLVLDVAFHILVKRDRELG